MIRLLAFVAALALAGSAEAASLKLERVVIVMRHGVRPPTQSAADLARWSDQAWPEWPVAPGELTPHGGLTVRLMGATLRTAYRGKGLIPPTGCAGAGRVTVWADGTDQRTRRTGEILAAALQPGCGVKAGNAPPDPRDPIFGGYAGGPCAFNASGAPPILPPPLSDAERARLDLATSRLQAIFAPNACAGSGAGTCFAPIPATGFFAGTPSLAEDLLLEYADGKPLNDVGWGRANGAAIAAVMPLHERSFAIIHANVAATSHAGAAMAKVVLDALNGRATTGGPQSGPDLKILGLAGHDTNLVLMASIFGLTWTLPGEPDGTAPSTALAFELWSDGAGEYVRPVIFYETLEQLRTLKPNRASALPLSFEGCATGPMGSCPLTQIAQHVEALIPADCSVAPAAPPPAAPPSARPG